MSRLFYYYKNYLIFIYVCLLTASSLNVCFVWIFCLFKQDFSHINDHGVQLNKTINHLKFKYCNELEFETGNDQSCFPFTDLGVRSFNAVSIASFVWSDACGSSLEALGLKRGTSSSSSSSDFFGSDGG